MECFCGCGRNVPRFPLGLRSINKRGAIITADIERVQMFLDRGLRSPNGEAFVADGRELQGALAVALHGGSDPGPQVEEDTREFMRRGRERFTEARIGEAVRKSGIDPDEAVGAMLRGEFDPFA